MVLPEIPDLGALAVWPLSLVTVGAIIWVAGLAVLPMLAGRDGSAPARLSPGMRWVFFQGALFVLLIGAPLYLAPGSTQTWFAFAIATPLSAAFLGANYVGVAFLGYQAARRKHWSAARIAGPCSLSFTLAMLYASLAGFDYFFPARAISWIWFGVYALVPVQMSLAWLWQIARHMPEGAGEAPAGPPLPAGLRLLMGGVAAVLAVAGILLLRAEPGTLTWWPWDLSGPSWPYRPDAIGPGAVETPPTAAPGQAAPMEPYAAIWMIALAVGFANAAVERGLDRLGPLFPALTAWGVLQFGALAMHAGAVRWAAPACWVWVALLITAALVGVWGMRQDAGQRTGAAPG